MKLFHRVLFVHTYRNANKAAHFCAQQALYGDFFWKGVDRNFDCLPQDLLYILEEDRFSLS